VRLPGRRPAVAAVGRSAAAAAVAAAAAAMAAPTAVVQPTSQSMWGHTKSNFSMLHTEQNRTLHS
jgi:hypothetical protein